MGKVLVIETDPKESGSKSENSSFESRAVEQQGESDEVKKLKIK